MYGERGAWVWLWRRWSFFLLDAAWVRSRADSYTKVTSKVARTRQNLQITNKLKQQICGSNKFRKAKQKGGDMYTCLHACLAQSWGGVHQFICPLSVSCLHSKEVGPLPSLRTCSSQVCYCGCSVVIMVLWCSLFPEGSFWLKSSQLTPSLDISALRRGMLIQHKTLRCSQAKRRPYGFNGPTTNSSLLRNLESGRGLPMSRVWKKATAIGDPRW